MRPMFLSFLLSLLCAAPLSAQTDSPRYEVSLRGIKAGQLAFDARQEGDAYAVSGVLQSTGFVGSLVKFRYEAQSAGRIKAGRYTPSQYSERANTGKRQQSSIMRYRNGVPQVREVTPARAPTEYDLDPAKQGGTVDILTALYAALRDQSPEAACTQRLEMFDGRRRSRLTLSDPQPQADGGLICAGEYRRVAGFHPDDMTERTTFGFSMTLAPVGDLLRVTKITTPTLYGTATLRRK